MCGLIQFIGAPLDGNNLPVSAQSVNHDSLRANIDETLTAAIIIEQSGKENHRERDQDCCSFCSQFA